MNLRQWYDLMPRFPRPARTKREKKLPAELKTWRLLVPVNGEYRNDARTVLAHTRSEARALVKAELKLARLPVGTAIVCLGAA
jgi:hypothetical protein